MAFPTAYNSTVAIPLPSDDAVRHMIGASYDPAKALNVLKMFAGTEDMFEATIGVVKAMFQMKGIDPRTREMIILRAAKVLNAPYEAQASVLMAKNAGLSAAESTRPAATGRSPTSIRTMFSSAGRRMTCQRPERCAMKPCSNFSISTARRSRASSCS
jgi:alkylhydroperoxidase/carboxymuconolactone decarboxylase family protein YurZ